MISVIYESSMLVYFDEKKGSYEKRISENSNQAGKGLLFDRSWQCFICDQHGAVYFPQWAAAWRHKRYFSDFRVISAILTGKDFDDH